MPSNVGLSPPTVRPPYRHEIGGQRSTTKGFLKALPPGDLRVGSLNPHERRDWGSQSLPEIGPDDGERPSDGAVTRHSVLDEGRGVACHFGARRWLGCQVSLGTRRGWYARGSSAHGQ
ncbi:hypothetical protein GOBAR_DD23691 [Gossypium barbadense]|nr:hypothetical protein GOBAR_DD23691 [Gossypium barbadense]